MNYLMYFCPEKCRIKYKINHMIPALRKEFIMNTLNEKGILNIQEIVQKFRVSPLTVRRDLAELDEKGLLSRTRGGAVKSKATDLLFTYDLKINQHRQNKEAICKLASGYVTEGDILFIDCGTTLSLFTKYIAKFKSLTVITTSLPVISELMNYQNIRLSLIGGEIDYERQAVYGPVAENTIGMYHASKAFIGADGISLKNGLSSFDAKEGAITQKIMENTDEVFLLCDSSKIEKNSYIRFASLQEIHHLITDQQITPEQLKMYRDTGLDVIIE